MDLGSPDSDFDCVMKRKIFKVSIDVRIETIRKHRERNQKFQADNFRERHANAGLGSNQIP